MPKLQREKALEELAGCLEDLGRKDEAKELRRRVEEIRARRAAH